MSYFADHYADFSIPLEAEDQVGFRLAQAGAIHALASHFSMRSEPAIVSMPTGSGKTAVLIAAAFILRAKRALILTPIALALAFAWSMMRAVRETWLVTSAEFIGPKSTPTTRRTKARSTPRKPTKGKATGVKKRKHQPKKKAIRK
ncbi:MAG: DEAD/DEAH box helicase family protein [Alphaproteobacteria bacterium]|nr:DEAD/DEAH box helicase family protein [Alphaproteobacteria bacterium]MBL7097340.1 DEAD/DEAH box helicase family protein [Alphaproteobacteria bacterium]